MSDAVIFPTYNISTKQAVDIVKNGLYDNTIAIETKVHAIEHVANMATHNSISKDELVDALRWMFEHYSFYD